MFKYYFVITSLPKLSFTQRADIIFDEVIRLLELNLSQSDLNKINAFRTFIDIMNLRKIWQNKEIDHRGNLNENELKDQMLIQDVLYDFVFEYMQKYESSEARLKNFCYLTANFFNYVINNSNGFLKKYFSFIREYRLILTALRAKNLNKDIVKELEFEDLTSNFVEYILAQKDSPELQVPMEYEELKKIYLNNKNDPKNLHFLLLQYQFNEIDKMMDDKPFTIDQILAYFAQLLLIEDYQSLNVEKGKEKLDSLIEG
ncbi:MAG: hypothetical protein K1060chlam5_00039 [Candidatus Anoxychlamydiales bacterium]|nr:hypothetical protein [Candidatus Anoxychlamydiales bacterium]